MIQRALERWQAPLGAFLFGLAIGFAAALAIIITQQDI